MTCIAPREPFYYVVINLDEYNLSMNDFVSGLVIGSVGSFPEPRLIGSSRDMFYRISPLTQVLCKSSPILSQIGIPPKLSHVNSL